MIQNDWIIPLSMLSNSILKSPILKIPGHNLDFQLLLVPRNSKAIESTITFQFNLLSKIAGSHQIFFTLTFISNDGPKSDCFYSFGGTYSRNSTSISTDQTEFYCSTNIKELINHEIPISFFDQSDLISQQSIHIHISIGLIHRQIEGISGFAVASPNEIVAKLLSPHDSKKACLVITSEINWICQASVSLLLSQPSLLRLQTPIILVGDLHGQYFDLIRIFRKYGFPNVANYLFLGDYVDRGSDSLDIILLLLTFKLLYPNNIFLLRGNHECFSVSSTYGFKDECEHKDRPYACFLPVFESLPIASIVGNKIFCVHGGIAPSIESMSEIEQFQRPREVPSFGMIHELLWSDPSVQISGFGQNSRGSCLTFGPKAARDFMKKFDFEMIVRAHELVQEGFSFPFGKTMNVVTLFSATQYSTGNNLGAVMIIDDSLNYYFDTYQGLREDEKRQYERTDFNKYV